MPRFLWPFRSKQQTGAASKLPASTAPTPRRHIVILAGIVLALGLWAALALPVPGTTIGALEAGRPSPGTFQAPQSAEFESDLRTSEARSQAENRPENLVYTTDRNLPIEQSNAMIDLFDTISSIRSDPSLSETEKQSELTDLPSSSVVISNTLASAILSLDDSAWNTVRSRSLALYERALAEHEYEIDERALQSLQERSLPFWTSNLPRMQRDLVLFFTSSFLRVNRTLDEEATAARKQQARESVEPVVVEVQAGETIVRDGEIVTPEMIEMLEQTGGLPRRLSLLDLGGYAVISVMLSIITMLYLVLLQRDIVRYVRPLMVIIGLIILTLLSARLLLPHWPQYPYAFPLATVVLVFTVVFNSHLALASAILLAVMMGMIGGNSLPLSITMMIGSVVAVFSVRGAERPLTFLLAGAGIALATGIGEIGFWLLQTVSPNWITVGNITFFSAVNGILSSILALGLFNLVGHVSGVVTPLQLMELAHPSQPLLRKLMREAPGTYAHSVSVGNLAEAAAEAVGADALLLRVSAYYHDIGKTLRPYFFTDNQTGRENVHNDLDPHTSATIIIDHVREGIKMAEEARLPQPIIDFIATHHGTHTVSHFYQLALREQDTVDINDFRYPGPTPFTREQGIMMLADSVEATVRAKAQHGQIIARPVHDSGGNGYGGPGGSQTIDQLVGSIIDDRVRSGQLDNTSLTLRDLVRIRQAFVNSLQGIYHPRVEYAPQMVKS